MDNVNVINIDVGMSIYVYVIRFSVQVNVSTFRMYNVANNKIQVNRN